MSLTLRMVLLLVAVILFLVDAFTNISGVALTPLGLAFFAGAFLVPETVLGARR